MYQTVSRRYDASNASPDLPTRVPMSRMEKYFHLFAMVTQFGGVLPLYITLTGQDVGIGDSAPINTVTMAAILAVSTVMGIRYRDNIIRAIPGMTPVLLFLALAIASAIWSDYPGISLRRSGTAITTALWGAYLASRFGLRDVIVLIAESIFIIAVGSMLLGLTFHETAIDLVNVNGPDSTIGWRGILDGKNTLGIVMATGMSTMTYLIISPGTRSRDKVLWIIGILLCAALLYLSQSRTSWVAGMVGVIVCVVARGMYRRPAITTVVMAWLVLLGVPLALFILNDLSTLTSLIGKDATLTGRVDLWQIVLPYGDKRPWLGYGYSAFWHEDSPRTQEIWRILNSYKPPHAHNGWIETYLELGWLGCIVVAIQMLQMLISAARATAQGRDVDAPYMLLIVVMMLIFNMVEADLIRAPALFWPFLIIGPVAMTKAMRQAPRAALTKFDPRARFAPAPTPLLTPRLNLAAPPPLKLRPGPLRPFPLAGH